MQPIGQLPLSLQMLLASQQQQSASFSPSSPIPSPAPLGFQTRSPSTPDSVSSRRTASGIVAVVSDSPSKDSLKAQLAVGNQLRRREEKVTVTLKPSSSVGASIVSKLVEVPYAYLRGNTVAVTDTYIAYHVRDGSVRLIDQKTTGRGLIKLPADLTDMSTWSPLQPLLTCADKAGNIALFALSSEGDKVLCASLRTKTQLRLRPPVEVEATKRAVVRVLWHPTQRLLAIATANRRVKVLKLPESTDAYNELLQTADPADREDVALDYDDAAWLLRYSTPNDVSDISFSSSGGSVYVGLVDGRLLELSLDGSVVASAQAHESRLDAVVASHAPRPNVFPPAVCHERLLVTLGQGGAELKLWRTDDLKLLQTIALESPKRASGGVHVAWDESCQFLLVSHCHESAFAVFHLYAPLRNEESGSVDFSRTRFDFVSEFPFTMGATVAPSRGFAVLNKADAEETHGKVDSQLQVFAHQGIAVQCFRLSPAQCYSPYELEDTHVEPIDSTSNASSVPKIATPPSAPVEEAETAREEIDEDDFSLEPKAEELFPFSPPPRHEPKVQKKPSPIREPMREPSPKRESPIRAAAAPVEEAAVPRKLELEASSSLSSQPIPILSSPVHVDSAPQSPSPPHVSAGFVVGTPTERSVLDQNKRGRATRKRSQAGEEEAEGVPKSSAAPVEESEGLVAQLTRAMQQQNERLYARLAKERREEVAALQASVAELRAAQTRQEEAHKAQLKALSEGAMKDMEQRLVKTFAQLVIPRVEMAVKDAIEKSASTTLRAVTAEQFKLYFTQVLAPSFERSTHNMFTQLADAFDKGLAAYQAQMVAAAPAPSAPAVNADALLSALTSLVAQAAPSPLPSPASSSASLPMPVVVAMPTPKPTAPAVNVPVSVPVAVLAQPAAVPRSASQPTPQSSSSSSVASAAASSSGAKVSLRARLDTLLAQKDFEGAFTQALAANNLKVLSWLLATVELDDVFGQARPQLSQTVLIALLQQISVSLVGAADALRKLDWITAILPDLDPLDPSISEYVELVLSELVVKLSQVDPALSRQAKAVEGLARRVLMASRR